MDKIKETYETASWIFRELITLKEFRKEIEKLSKSHLKQFTGDKNDKCRL